MGDFKFRMWARAKNVPKGSRCSYCGGWAQVIEHLIPSLKPGEFRWNEVYACVPCNGVKMNFQKRYAPIRETIALLEIEPHIESVFSRVPKCWQERGDGYEFWSDWCRQELHQMFSVDYEVDAFIHRLYPRSKELRAISISELSSQLNSPSVMVAEKRFERRLKTLMEKSSSLGYGEDLEQWESLAGDICLGLYEADSRNRAYFKKVGFSPCFEAGQ